MTRVLLFAFSLVFACSSLAPAQESSIRFVTFESDGESVTVHYRRYVFMTFVEETTKQVPFEELVEEDGK